MKQKQKIAGHTFLSHLGKTRLRPGGIEATNWLLSNITIGKEHHVLEVACNQGTTLLELANKSSAHYVGCDINTEVLEKARNNAHTQGLSHQVQFLEGDALQLPFKDSMFDYVINEALLTMLSDSQRVQALNEYHRVLKPGGFLLTHDIACIGNDAVRHDVRSCLTRINEMHVDPLHPDAWCSLLSDAHFEPHAHCFPMTLLSPSGLMHDEGIPQALRILRNGLRKANRTRFLGMRTIFKDNKDSLRAIAILSKKMEP